MASVSKAPNGRRVVQFVGADGKRRSVRLGRCSQKAADSIRVHVERLLEAKITGYPLNAETAAWLAGRGDDLIAKLARAGLVPRRESATLGAFLDDYIASRIDVAPASKVVWHHTRRNLVDFFGGDRALRTIGPADADAFRLHLVGEKLADTTIAKRLQFARQFFAVAKRRKLVDENPLAEVKHKAGATSGRQRFIDRATTQKLLDAAPDWTWRTIIALARYGGLRTPSETLSLTWDAVDWGSNRLRVVSPKTAKVGKGFRTIPMFPELRPYLQEAWDMAEEGQVHVVPTRYRDAAQGPNGWINCNMRTQFERIVKRAGLETWPRLFHNLRASRETELAAEHPVHVVTAWLGNTPTIAMRHYLQVTDSDFARAVQNPVHGAHDSGPTVQNPVQPMSAGRCHETTEPLGEQGVRHVAATVVHHGRESLADGRGFEPPEGFTPQQFSRLPPSSTRPPIRSALL